MFSVELNFGVFIVSSLNGVYHNLYASIDMKNIIEKSINAAIGSAPSQSCQIRLARAWPKPPMGPNIIPKTGATPISATIYSPP